MEINIDKTLNKFNDCARMLDACGDTSGFEFDDQLRFVMAIETFTDELSKILVREMIIHPELFEVNEEAL